MAIIYYDAQATGANNGTSKSDAFITIAAALSASNPGDIVYASHTSHETGGSITLTLNGASVISIDFSGSTPPTSDDWLPGATFEALGGVADINIRSSSNGYCYGLQFVGEDDLNIAYGEIIHERCSFEVARSNAFMNMGNSVGTYISCDFIASNTLAWFALSGGGLHTIVGGSFSGIALGLIRPDTSGGKLIFKNVDFSAYDGTVITWPDDIFPNNLEIQFEGCLLNPTAILSSGISATGQILKLYGTSSANQPYIIHEESFVGIIQSETTIIKSDGASDGTVPISLKLTTNDNVSQDLIALTNEIPILFWASNAGINTFEIDLLSDGLNLSASDVWLDICHPQASVLRAITSSLNRSGAILESSTATWDTTGLTVPNKQKISLSVDVGQPGWIEAHLYVSRPSAVIYADIKILEGSRQFLAGQVYANGEQTEITKYELPQELIIEDEEQIIYEGCDP